METETTAATPAPSLHHELSPSQFPMWAKCSRFTSGPVGEAAERGTLEHAALAAWLTDAPAIALPDDSREAVEWAKKWLSINASTPLLVEQRLELRDDDFEIVTFGTADVIDVPARAVIDYKSGEVRDYSPQLAAYALMTMQTYDWPECTGVVLYGRYRRAETYSFTREAATNLVWDIIHAREDPDDEPVPCDYCGWCSLAHGCRALIERANAVAAARDDWQLEQYHGSQIVAPEQMAKALALAEHLEKWADSVKFAAREMTIKQGLTIPGWRLQQRKGRPKNVDVLAVFADSGLRPDQFLPACEIVAGRLETIMREANGTRAAEAKKTVAGIIAAHSEQGEPSLSLVRERAKAAPDNVIEIPGTAAAPELE